jgi:hypothetical protein
VLGGRRRQQEIPATVAASWLQPRTVLASSKAFLAAEGTLDRLTRPRSPASELPQFEYRMPLYAQPLRRDGHASKPIRMAGRRAFYLTFLTTERDAV